MRKLLIVTCLVISGARSCAQSQEAEQLLLNWEKLTQFKVILHDMYEGWKLINEGYKSIREISSGNFSLHKNFLDALMEVSPAVKQYARIAEIIKFQGLLVRQAKDALNNFKNDDAFTLKEIEHITGIYHNLYKESLKNVEELSLIITSELLRMNDEERLAAIDRIYDRAISQYSFFKDVTSSTTYLSLQRNSEKAEIDLLKRIYGH